jgi:hypothetical protein
VRCFPEGSTLAAVRAWALLSVPEAAGGRPFALATALGGGGNAAVAAALAEGTGAAELSVAEAGLAGCSLLFRWAASSE